MKMKSHIVSAVAMSCVEKMTVVPARLRSSTASRKHLGVDRIESAERLVENHQRRLGDDGGDELHLLRHALGKRLHLFVAPRRQVEPLKPGVDRRPGSAHAFQLGVEAQQLADLHLLVQAALLGQIARRDRWPRRSLSRRAR